MGKHLVFIFLGSKKAFLEAFFIKSDTLFLV